MTANDDTLTNLPPDQLLNDDLLNESPPVVQAARCEWWNRGRFQNDTSYDMWVKGDFRRSGGTYGEATRKVEPGQSADDVGICDADKATHRSGFKWFYYSEFNSHDWAKVPFGYNRCFNDGTHQATQKKYKIYCV